MKRQTIYKSICIICGIIAIITILYLLFGKKVFNIDKFDDTLPLNAYTAQYVRIYSNGTNPLNIAGVFIYDDNGNNIITDSSTGTATMSSVAHSSLASNALKISAGINRNIYYNIIENTQPPNPPNPPPPKKSTWQVWNPSDNYIAHSAENESSYWQYVFNTQKRISAVEIYPRAECCPERNENLTVVLYANAPTSTSTSTSTDSIGNSIAQMTVRTPDGTKSAFANFSTIVPTTTQGITTTMMTPTTTMMAPTTTMMTPTTTMMTPTTTMMTPTTTMMTPTTTMMTPTTTMMASRRVMMTPSTTMMTPTTTMMAPSTDMMGVATTMMAPNTTMMTPTTTMMTPTNTMMASSTDMMGVATNINKTATKYQALSCRFLNITINKMHIAGIIVLDENGKNIFYGKNYNDIEALPINTIKHIIDATEPNEYRLELYKKTNELFKQTVNINYDNSATDEYNINLLNQIDYVNPENIFSINDNLARDIIINLNPGENKGNILVSKVIILLSKNICDNGIPCSFDNLEVNVALLSTDFTPIFDWVKERNLNPYAISPTPTMPKITRLNWKYNNNSNYILNFIVSDKIQYTPIEEFKNIKVKSKFYNIGTVINPDRVDLSLITNMPNPPSATTPEPTTTMMAPTTTMMEPTRSMGYATLPQISPSQTIALLNSGVNLDTLSSKGIAMNSAHRGPSTNIVQTNFTGTSNIYSPYLYYNKGVNEQFSGLTTDTNQNYSLF